MTLSTHSIIGAAIAVALPTHPVIGAVAAFASHFLLDALPHWDYKIFSASANPNKPTALKFDKLFALDLLRIGFDAVLGLALAGFFFFSPATWWLCFMGAIMAQLPDFLQFVYSKFPDSPIKYVQQFHTWIHTDQKLVGMPFIGITSQIVVIIFAVGCFFIAF